MILLWACVVVALHRAALHPHVLCIIFQATAPAGPCECKGPAMWASNNRKDLNCRAVGSVKSTLKETMVLGVQPVTIYNCNLEGNCRKHPKSQDGGFSSTHLHRLAGFGVETFEISLKFHPAKMVFFCLKRVGYSCIEPYNPPRWCICEPRNDGCFVLVWIDRASQLKNEQ